MKQLYYSVGVGGVSIYASRGMTTTVCHEAPSSFSSVSKELEQSKGGVFL